MYKKNVTCTLPGWSLFFNNFLAVSTFGETFDVNFFSSVLSGGKIFFDLTAKHTGGLSQQQTLGLQCHVWGAFSPLTLGSKLTSAMNDIMCGSSTGDLSKSFLE